MDDLLLTFEVYNPGETNAGILPYGATVQVYINNDPGGCYGEFTEYIQNCLREWFDGDSVNLC